MLFSPFIGLLTIYLFIKRNTAIVGIIFAFSLIGYMATINLFVTDNVARYLHPVGFFMFILLGVIISGSWSLLKGKRADG